MAGKGEPGKCHQGWILVPVPDGAQPALVRYSPGGTVAADWIL
jgi:hypothetical protein